MVGTPADMSPQQVLGHDIDGRADLYAMGGVLFRLLTSELPFKAESGVAVAQRHLQDPLRAVLPSKAKSAVPMAPRQLNDPPTPVREVRSELPHACDEILTRALSKA